LGGGRGGSGTEMEEIIAKGERGGGLKGEDLIRPSFLEERLIGASSFRKRG